MYNVHYLGAKIICVKITNKDLKLVKKIISKNNKSANSDLAGVIEHEHIINKERYQEIISPYLNTFMQAHADYGLSKASITAAWVNYMKAGEYNPLHVHQNGNVSSVLFIDTPKDLKKENIKWQRIKKESAGPGTLEFVYGEMSNFISFRRNFFPAQGELFIFSNNLKHCVYPFTCKGERISVAANFIFE